MNHIANRVVMSPTIPGLRFQFTQGSHCNVSSMSGSVQYRRIELMLLVMVILEPNSKVLFVFVRSSIAGHCCCVLSCHTGANNCRNIFEKDELWEM